MPSVLNSLANQLCLAGCTFVNCVDKRQCRLAFGKVVTDIFAGIFGGCAVVEHVINQLEGNTQMQAVTGQCIFNSFRLVTKHCADLCGGFKQARGLAATTSR